MKKRIKDIIIGILIGCVLTTTTPVLANSILTKIDVVLDGIEVKVEGEKLDANTILYNGSTYLPMRKVAEAVGKDVEWNQETRTANIVEKLITEESENMIIEQNNKYKIIQGDITSPDIIELNGEEHYYWSYVAKNLLNDKYTVDGDKYKDGILVFYDAETSFEVECKVIDTRIFISKEYYENTILPLIN